MKAIKSAAGAAQVAEYCVPAGIGDELRVLVRDAVREAIEEAAPPGEYLHTRDAAAYLGVSYQFLTIGRHKRRGPPFVKLGHAVRYRRADLDAWMSTRRHAPDEAAP